MKTYPISEIRQRAPILFKVSGSAPLKLKRSRAGCFTCRIRCKKCDEAKPSCVECKRLGLYCGYTQPEWWKDTKQRCAVREGINDLVGRNRRLKNMRVASSPTRTICTRRSTDRTFPEPPAHVDGTFQAARNLEEDDQRLLSYFFSDILPTAFPVIEVNRRHRRGSALTDYIIHALHQRSFLHCCLSIAAEHSFAMSEIQGAKIMESIVHHKRAITTGLMQAVSHDMDHQAILEATLGVIYLPCLAGAVIDTTIPDLPWHYHFRAATAVVQDHGFHHPEASDSVMKFNIALTAWIDILGSAMKGCVPAFASLYRETYTHLTQSSLRLRELMGCEDRVMYLNSEVACLEALRQGGIDDARFYQCVRALSDEMGRPAMGEPRGPRGGSMAEQLIQSTTSAFRIAARIYLCSLVPEFSSSHPTCVSLVSRLTQVLEDIPSGSVGFDRSLSWVYLIGGSVSAAGSNFRSMFDHRIVLLGDAVKFGSFGRVSRLLREVWKYVDGEARFYDSNMHWPSWRQVMQLNGWDFLVI